MVHLWGRLDLKITSTGRASAHLGRTVMLQPDSVYWRNKAEEYRTSADSFRDHSARAAYALLAKSADALARRQEQLAEHLSAKAGSKLI
jgi:acyl-CoA reductase-like NAD-dependent aldehyde dehydrogenase